MPNGSTLAKKARDLRFKTQPRQKIFYSEITMKLVSVTAFLYDFSLFSVFGVPLPSAKNKNRKSEYVPLRLE